MDHVSSVPEQVAHTILERIDPLLADLGRGLAVQVPVADLPPPGIRYARVVAVACPCWRGSAEFPSAETQPSMGSHRRVRNVTLEDCIATYKAIVHVAVYDLAALQNNRVLDRRIRDRHVGIDTHKRTDNRISDPRCRMNTNWVIHANLLYRYTEIGS
jgi:hypothetical protein